MNRSFTNVLFGAFGQVQAAKAGAAERSYKAETIEGAAQILEQASNVVIIPGYGLAVAQAQRRVPVRRTRAWAVSFCSCARVGAERQSRNSATRRVLMYFSGFNQRSDKSRVYFLFSQNANPFTGRHTSKKNTPSAV